MLVRLIAAIEINQMPTWASWGWGQSDSNNFRGLAMKSRALWLGVFLVLSLAAFGQDSASITGTVTDQSGAAVANAQVTLSSPERGINRTSQTNESGDYLFGAVPGGSYDLIVVGAGFKKYSAKGVKLPGRAKGTRRCGAAGGRLQHRSHSRGLGRSPG